MFWRNIPLLASTGFLLGLHFNPEDMFIHNARLSPNYTVL
jgi:hypothetical protein